MLTLFTTAKPFEGHSGVIQRNALKSWKRLHPDVEVILFGDDAGLPAYTNPSNTNPSRDCNFMNAPSIKLNRLERTPLPR
jgi:hypothetical protein